MVKIIRIGEEDDETKVEDVLDFHGISQRE